MTFVLKTNTWRLTLMRRAPVSAAEGFGVKKEFGDLECAFYCSAMSWLCFALVCPEFRVWLWLQVWVEPDGPDLVVKQGQ